MAIVLKNIKVLTVTKKTTIAIPLIIPIPFAVFTVAWDVLSYTNRPTVVNSNVRSGLDLSSAAGLKNSILNTLFPDNITTVQSNVESLTLGLKYNDADTELILGALFSILNAAASKITEYTFNFVGNNFMVMGLQYLGHSIDLMNQPKSLVINFGYTSGNVTTSTVIENKKDISTMYNRIDTKSNRLPPAENPKR